MLGAGIIDDGEAVLRFAASVIMCAFAAAYAAKVGKVAVEAELAQCFGGGLDDFVGVRPALEGLGWLMTATPRAGTCSDGIWMVSKMPAGPGMCMVSGFSIMVSS